MTATFGQAHRALEFLEQHWLEPTAVNYDLALSYVKNADSDLARDIDQQTEDGLRLTPEAAATLVDRYLVRNPNVLIGQRKRKVEQHSEELGTLTSGAHELTSALERDVGAAVVQAVEWPSAASDFVSRLSDAERELAELRRNVAKLQTKIGGADGRQRAGDQDDLTPTSDQDDAHDWLERLTSDGLNYVMVMFSLDNMVRLNKRFGHSVGDNVLNALDSTLRRFLPEDELIRWSGNEFVAIVKGTALVSARLLAEEALAAVKARRFKLRGSGEWIGTVTASAGIAVCQNEDAMDVLERVRANTHVASESGGNRLEG